MPGITSAIATTDFLSLLTIQLKNQDPLDPVKQDQFISQLAQFSNLEGIESLNSKFEETLRIDRLNQGIQLVGKEAEYIDSESGERISGVVEQLFADQGPVDLLINGQRISIDLVSGVKA